MTGRILIVDDDHMVLDVLDAFLTESGHEVLKFLDSTTALGHFVANHVSNQPLDLVITDCSMPVMDGFKLLECIRHLEERSGILLGQGVPVLMLTGYGYSVGKNSTHDFDDFLPKPFEESQLLAKVGGLLERNGNNGNQSKEIIKPYNHIITIK